MLQLHWDRRLVPGNPPAPKTRTHLDSAKPIGSQAHAYSGRPNEVVLVTRYVVRCSTHTVPIPNTRSECSSSAIVVVVPVAAADNVNRQSADMTATRIHGSCATSVCEKTSAVGRAPNLRLGESLLMTPSSQDTIGVARENVEAQDAGSNGPFTQLQILMLPVEASAIADHRHRRPAVT